MYRRSNEEDRLSIPCHLPHDFIQIDYSHFPSISKSNAVTEIDRRMSCFVFSLLLHAFTLPPIVFPSSVQLDIPDIGNMSNFECIVDFGATEIAYNQSTVKLALRDGATSIECRANFSLLGDPSLMVVALEVPPGRAVIDTSNANASSEAPCWVTNATLRTCSLAPSITTLTLYPAAPNAIFDSILQWAQKVFNNATEPLLCDAISSQVVHQLVNRTDVARTAPPAFHGPICATFASLRRL